MIHFLKLCGKNSKQIFKERGQEEEEEEADDDNDNDNEEDENDDEARIGGR